MDDYKSLTHDAGIIDFSQRTRIEVSGDDRAGFLHNLSTNDVKGLPVGGGCEAFFLDARGHVLGHVFLIVGPESIVIETVGGQNELLLKHLNRYLIREKVELHDRTNEWGELLIAGAESQPVLTKLSTGLPPAARLANAIMEVAGQPATVVRVEMTQPGGYLVLLKDRDGQQALTESLRIAGAVVCGPSAFEAARLEAGFPLYGQDMTDKNLPQEVNRNELAISFRKGCYLGQETVARIDALGHVNKTLIKLRFESEAVPPPGAELVAGDVEVGQVTSAAYSPRARSPIALAYARRGSDQPGMRLSSAYGPAEIVS